MPAGNPSEPGRGGPSGDPRDAGAGSYHIETWGCQMNVHDAEKLAGLLEGAGYARAGGADDADVVLLNTCAIREKAAEKVFSELGRLRRLKERNPSVILGVCGCVAQQEGAEIFRRAPYVDLVVGPRATGSIRDALRDLRERPGRPGRFLDTAYREDSIRFPFDEIRREGAATGKAFVTIIEGCNHRCTYCVVPRTRGREICRDMDDVLREVRALVARGVLEVEFLGQTVNAYRDGRGRDLAALLGAASAFDGLRRIRFTTSHPAQMTPRLIDAMAAARPKLCPYLHLPVQSGSDPVLQRMRRGYDRAAYLGKLAALRTRIPEMTFGTDVIVGFPGEEEEDLRATLELLDEVRYDTVYSFAYSERPGTRAADFGDPVPPAVKVERLERVQALQKAIQTERMGRWVGHVLEVLVEGPSRRDPSRWVGRCPSNRVVHFAERSAPGRIEHVRIAEATPYSLLGTRTPAPAGLCSGTGP